VAHLSDPKTVEQKRRQIDEAIAARNRMTEAETIARQEELIAELRAGLAAIPYDIADLERQIREWRIEPPMLENFFFVAFSGTVFMGCTSDDPNLVKPLVNVMTLCSSVVPDTIPIFFQTSIFGNLREGNSVDVEIRGDDLDAVTRSAGALQLALLTETGSYPQAEPSNFDRGRLEARLTPDRVRAGDVGMSVDDVGFIVRACAYGSIIGQFREAGESYDLSIRVKGTTDLVEGEGQTVDITQTPIATPSGRIVPLTAVCGVEQVLAPERIDHIETQRAVKLTVRPPPGKPVGAVLETVQGVVAQMRGDGYQMPPRMGGFAARLDPHVIVGYAGNASKLKTTWDSLKWLLLLSGLIVYLLMAGLFESFVYPFVIITTVPLAVVGGFLGLWLINRYTYWDVTAAVQELDMLTILGFVILLGIVVNNGILIVHQSLNFARDGMPMPEAIPEAVRTRIRPIFMTTLTTFFGQLPLVLRPGAGAELYRGLGAVVLGGLLVSTVFTLIVVPAMLSIFSRGRRLVQAAVSHGALPVDDRSSSGDPVGAPEPAGVTGG
jgi:HAE1 family hydrophobic/amphiphilic exporter-1